MKKTKYYILVLMAMAGCIGTDTEDDMVPEKIEITNPLVSLKVGDSYELMYRYLNNVGMEESANVSWTSTNEGVFSVDQDGALMALTAGESEISVVLSENNQVMDKIVVQATDETVLASGGAKTGTIETTSSYVLTGDFSVSEIDGGVQISIGDNYSASSALPGLYVYLTNNPSTVSGALEIGAVSVFSGAHNYNVTADGLTPDTYDYLLYFCKPFNVKVGHGEILD